ncbi:hypothetical protein LL912_19160 [Niabella sp. CC-SYL272]|uniref:hypothetical protein n=1 Tax=Niabella agricola TaxID=2891571 RepID=UPI001F3A4D1D|nr:hypothetical protein [Niabella agricola]MCF3110913.1 hypothetical protein [Niabella agricola]
MRQGYYYILLLLLTACSNPAPKAEPEQNIPITENNQNMQQEKSGFLYMDKKREPFTNGRDNYNEMLLYAIGDTVSVEQLKQFCSNEKAKFTDGMFHIIVFFDKKENAVFPNNPVTALFIEQEQLQHIKAVYTYNRVNGYSKLSYYENNAWESKVDEIQIN